MSTHLMNQGLMGSIEDRYMTLQRPVNIINELLAQGLSPEGQELLREAISGFVYAAPWVISTPGTRLPTGGAAQPDYRINRAHYERVMELFQSIIEDLERLLEEEWAREDQTPGEGWLSERSRSRPTDRRHEYHVMFEGKRLQVLRMIRMAVSQLKEIEENDLLGKPDLRSREGASWRIAMTINYLENIFIRRDPAFPDDDPINRKHVRLEQETEIIILMLDTGPKPGSLARLTLQSKIRNEVLPNYTDETARQILNELIRALRPGLTNDQRRRHLENAQRSYLRSRTDLKDIQLLKQTLYDVKQLITQGTRLAQLIPKETLFNGQSKKRIVYFGKPRGLTLYTNWYMDMVSNFDIRRTDDPNVAHVVPKTVDTKSYLEIRYQPDQVTLIYYDYERGVDGQPREEKNFGITIDPDRNRNDIYLERYSAGRKLVDLIQGVIPADGTPREDVVVELLETVADHTSDAEDRNLISIVTQEKVPLGRYHRIVFKGLEMPIEIIKDRKSRPRFVMISELANPSNYFVLEINGRELKVLGTDESILVAGDEKVDQVLQRTSKRVEEFYQNMFRGLNLLGPVDRTSPVFLKHPDLKEKWYAGRSISQDIQISLKPYTVGDIDRRWLSTGRKEREQRGKDVTAYLIDLIKLEGSVPTVLPSDAVIAGSQGRFMTVPLSSWSNPQDWIGRVREGVYDFYQRIGEDNRRDIVVFRRIDRGDRITTVQTVRLPYTRRRIIQLEGLTIDGEPLLIESGTINLSALLYLLSDKDSGILGPQHRSIVISPELASLALEDIEDLINMRKTRIPTLLQNVPATQTETAWVLRDSEQIHWNWIARSSDHEVRLKGIEEVFRPVRADFNAAAYGLLGARLVGRPRAIDLVHVALASNEITPAVGPDRSEALKKEKARIVSLFDQIKEIRESYPQKTFHVTLVDGEDVLSDQAINFLNGEETYPFVITRVSSEGRTGSEILQTERPKATTGIFVDSQSRLDTRHLQVALHKEIAQGDREAFQNVIRREAEKYSSDTTLQLDTVLKADEIVRLFPREILIEMLPWILPRITPLDISRLIALREFYEPEEMTLLPSERKPYLAGDQTLDVAITYEALTRENIPIELQLAMSGLPLDRVRLTLLITDPTVADPEAKLEALISAGLVKRGTINQTLTVEAGISSFELFLRLGESYGETLDASNVKFIGAQVETEDGIISEVDFEIREGMTEPFRQINEKLTYLEIPQSIRNVAWLLIALFKRGPGKHIFTPKPVDWDRLKERIKLTEKMHAEAA